MILAYLGWSLIAVGTFFIVSSILGLFRMKDIYTKMHAASVSDSFGIPLCLLGFALIQDNIISSFKILLIIIFFLVLGPTGSHALISAAWRKDEKNNEDSK